jgi:L-iditol 2-dehydrogenase
VIAVDVDEARLATARTLGADDCLNAKTVDVPAYVREKTEGRGADIAVEVVGATEPIGTALASVRKGGSLTLIGNITPKIELLLQSVVTRQIKLIGSCNSAGEYPACLDLLVRGAIRGDPMITAVAPMSEGVAWFHRLYKEHNLMKVILLP